MKDGPNFCKKGVRTDICFSSMLTPGKKMKEVIVYGHVLDKKPPLVSPNSPPARRNSSRKIGTVTEKPKIQKMRLKDSFDSPNGGTCEKMREVFVLHPVMRKTSLGFSKFIFICPESASEEDWSKLEKMVL
jgi:hypothetical protein